MMVVGNAITCMWTWLSATVCVPGWQSFRVNGKHIRLVDVSGIMSFDTHTEDHEVLSEFCSGYSDGKGMWINGFYCPWEQFCCGTETHKYCCTHKEEIVTEEFSRLPLLLGVVLGAVAAAVICTIFSCCFCTCCVLYKKRQPRLNDGPLYRMQCSSAASGMANMYSFTNPNSLVTTPMETAATSSSLLVDLEPVVSSGGVSPRGTSDGRATMSRGHTFSMETRLRESTDQQRHSPEPPPPYEAAGSYPISEEETHNTDTTLQVVSHQMTSTQQTFGSTGQTQAGFYVKAVTPASSGSGIALIEPQQLPSPSPSTFSAGVTPELTLPESARTAGGKTTMLIEEAPASSVPPTIHEVLYHSTKF